MTTRIELTRALEAKGITMFHTDDDPENGPCDYIQWIKEYNYIAGFVAHDGMVITSDLLMGWHFSDSFLHISTVGAEFTIDNIARHRTEEACQMIARFIAGTYYVSARMTPPVPEYAHVRDYPITD